MNKKHIVIDARILETTTGRYCRGLFDGLSQIPEAFDNFRYTILAPKKTYRAWQKLYGEKFKFVPCDIKNYSFAEQTKLRKVLNKLKPDLVHFSMPQQPVLYNSSPVITTFHDLTLLKTYNSDKNWFVFHAKQAVGKWVFAHALKKSSSILTPSNYTKDDIIHTFGHIDRLPNKITTTYLAGKLPKSIDAEKSEDTESDFVAPKNYLLYVGNQVDYKNIPRLMQAHQKLLEDFPDLHLVLASPPGRATDINRERAENKKYKNIVFTGWLSSKDLANLYKNCACYCFPSLMEGFGLPGLEAMGQGTPVASSNATCLPEIYDNAAIYFDPKDTSNMARKIQLILTDKKLRNDLIKKGEKRFAEFDWKKTAEETLQAYKESV